MRGFFSFIFNFVKAIINFAFVLAGIACIGLAYFYYNTPAQMLPPAFRVYQGDVGEILYMHVVGTILLSITCFLLAWLISGIGRKKPMPAPDNLTAPEKLVI